MRKVYLEGILGDKFGHEWSLDVKTPAEAVAAISAQRPGFRKFLLEGENVQGYEILFGKDSGLENEDELFLNMPPGQSFSFVPVIGGSKSGGLFMMVAGIALIAATGGLAFMGIQGMAAFGTTTTTLGTGAATGALTTTGAAGAVTSTVAAGGTVTVAGSMAGYAGAIGQLGMGLVLGGASMMLAPKVPDASEGAKQAENYLFDGVENNVKQGSAIPLVYGRMIVGSTVISSSLFTTTSRTQISRRRKLVGIPGFRTPGSDYGIARSNGMPFDIGPALG